MVLKCILQCGRQKHVQFSGLVVSPYVNNILIHIQRNIPPAKILLVPNPSMGWKWVMDSSWFPTQANSKRPHAPEGFVRACVREVATKWWILMGIINA